MYVLARLMEYLASLHGRFANFFFVFSPLPQSCILFRGKISGFLCLEEVDLVHTSAAYVK